LSYFKAKRKRILWRSWFYQISARL